MKAIKYILLLIIASLSGQVIKAQDKILSEGSILIDEPILDEETIALIDTLFIDHDPKNWSIRAFTSYKDQRIKVKNKDSEYLLYANNPYGVGIGVATKKLIVDIGFTLKNKDVVSSKKFNLSGDFILAHNLVGFNFHSYKGLSVEQEGLNYKSFREDIVNHTVILSYMYMFNTQKYSPLAIKTGLARQKKSAFSLGIGAMGLYNYISGDSSFVMPEFEEQFNNYAKIHQASSLGIGLNVGLNAFIALPADFFISLNMETGMGYVDQRIESENGYYRPTDPKMFQLKLNSSIGYNGKSIYLNFSFTHIIMHSDLGMGNQGEFNNTKAKLVLGYKLGSED